MTFMMFDLLFLIFKKYIMLFLSIKLESQHLFVEYTISMITTSMVGCWSYIVLSIFYSVKKVNQSMLLIIVFSLINVILTYYLAIYFNLGIYAIPLGILISSSLALIVGYYALVAFNIVTLSYPIVDKKSIIHCLKSYIVSGSPVFISYLAIFVGLFLFSGILSRISLIAVSGYGVAYRLQTFLIMPAIAIGVACAIYINDYLANHDYIMARKALRSSLIFSLLIYLLISGVTYLFSDAMVSAVVGDSLIHSEAVRYLLVVSPSYLFFGPFITFLVISEQTGRGLWGLLLNSLYFLTVVGVSWIIIDKFLESTAFYFCISIINVLAFLGVALIISHAKKYLMIEEKSYKLNAK